MKTAELDYPLPEQLIAQQPLPQRDKSRLLVLRRDGSGIEHRRIGDLPNYLADGDCLVLNQSKVIPARFFARRATGGQVEGLFLQLNRQGQWQVLLKNASRLKIGEELILSPAIMRRDSGQELAAPLSEQETPQPRDENPPALRLTIIEELNRGEWLLQLRPPQDYLNVLEQFGVTPLPPYIRRPPEPSDRGRYQTVYATTPGSAAAPTAGLHFTDQLLRQLQEQGISIARLTLHVGLGTFQPVGTEELDHHDMHPERYVLDEPNAQLINAARQRGSRIVAVGTTAVRSLETAAKEHRVRAVAGSTRLFITPGYRFQIVDALLTNFHLPRTTLLALVCAFAGVDRVLAAYRTAVQMKYRFFSYGDAMLIL